MKQYIKLNNETFEVKKVKRELHPISEVRGLGDCYNNPSRTKYEIYHDWLKWYKGSFRKSRFLVHLMHCAVVP